MTTNKTSTPGPAPAPSATTTVPEPTKTKLSRTYTFWLTINAAESQKFEDAIKKIGTFDSVEDFWAIYQHLKRPEDTPAKADYNLVFFKRIILVC